MATQLGDRSAVLLGRDANYPPQIAFYVAHELGHLALGHIRAGETIVDLGDLGRAASGRDDEENAADRYALTVLTGMAEPKVVGDLGRGGARQLAEAALRASEGLRVEPGTLALCFGYNTRRWDVATGALRHIYERPKPVWQEVNGIALEQLDLAAVTEDARAYLETVLGMTAR